MENTITTASTTPGDGAGSVTDAAAAIEKLLSGNTEKRKTANADKVSQAETETPEVEETADTGDDAQETASEGSEDQTGDEAEAPNDEANEETEGDEPEERTFTVKIDGKDVQFTEQELQSSVLRHADYTRKTQALAEERKAFHAEAQRIQEERAQYAQLLPALTQQIQAAMPQPPDPRMRETDPLSYMLAKDEYEEKLGRINAANAEMQRLQSVQQEEQAKQIKSLVSNGYAKLLESVPEWKDQKVYDKERQQLRSFLNEAGYSDEEIDQAYDHRAILLARDAMKYRQLSSRKPRPDAPLEKALRPVPPVNSPAPRRAKEAQVLRSRLAETGKLEDAAAAIRSLL